MSSMLEKEWVLWSGTQRTQIWVSQFWQIRRFLWKWREHLSQEPIWIVEFSLISASISIRFWDVGNTDVDSFSMQIEQIFLLLKSQYCSDFVKTGLCSHKKQEGVSICNYIVKLSGGLIGV